METKIKGNFYDAVILQVMVPGVADVSNGDYNAEFINKSGQATDNPKDLRPFVVCHPLSLRMKVETWLGKEITWTFGADGIPMLLKTIFADPAPVLVNNGEPTATEITEIQIGY
jgi:hypothetical protein